MHNKKNDFRYDIQGLRAIAVLSVVIFHISPEHLPGGFLGVDIFFVISGFLIIGFIHRDLQAGRFSLNEFYFKRVKRLLPALLVVTLFSSIFSSFLLTPHELADYIKSLWSTFAYVSNFYFYSESGYFDTSLMLAPLLHTWSLSVEEQFYIIAPITLLFLFKKNRNTIVPSLIIFAFLSLSFSELYIYKDRDLSFYASPSRFWQFILGGIIALKYTSIRIKAAYYDVIGLVGLLAIAYCLFFYTEKTVFPGVNAILPTIASAMIIFSGIHQGWVYRTLSNKLGLFLGNISYSLYLWHWPIIVFYKLYNDSHLNISEMTFIFLLSITAGYLSWLYVEKNGRYLFPTPRNYTISILAIITICLSSFVFMSINKARFTEKEMRYISYLDYETTHFREGSCFLTSKHDDFELYDQKNCITHDKKKINYLLLGDSHAAHWFDAINKSKPLEATLTQATSSGCLPTIEYLGEKRCSDLFQWAVESLIPSKRFDKIILSARWNQQSLPWIISTIKKISPYTSDIVILGPTVEYRMSLPRILAFTKSEDEIKEHRKFDRVKGIDLLLAKALPPLKNIRYVSIFKLLCPTKENNCLTTTKKDIPITFDYGHFTKSGASHVMDQIDL